MTDKSIMFMSSTFDDLPRTAAQKRAMAGHPSRSRLRDASKEKYWAAYFLLMERYGNRCLRCGKLGKLSIDHIIPVSKGGSDFIGNLQLLCMACNRIKGDKTVDYRHLEHRQLPLFTEGQ